MCARLPRLVRPGGLSRVLKDPGADPQGSGSGSAVALPQPPKNLRGEQEDVPARAWKRPESRAWEGRGGCRGGNRAHCAFTTSFRTLLHGGLLGSGPMRHGVRRENPHPREAARIRADRLARRVAFEDELDRQALRSMVGLCYTRWYARRDQVAALPRVLVRGARWVLGICAGAVPLLPLATRLDHGLRGGALTLFDLDVAVVISVLLRIAARSGPIIAFAIRWRLVPAWQAGRWIPAGESLLPPNGLLILVDAAVQAGTVLADNRLTPDTRARLAPQLSTASRRIRADDEFAGTRASRRLLAARREQLNALASEVERRAGQIMVVDATAGVREVHAVLLDVLRSWSRGSLGEFVSGHCQLSRRSVWRGRIRDASGSIVLFGVGLAFLLAGGRYSGGAVAVMATAVLSCVNAPFSPRRREGDHRPRVTTTGAHRVRICGCAFAQLASTPIGAASASRSAGTPSGGSAVAAGRR